MNGRFLISMDFVRPPQSGTVIGRDLNNPGTPDIQSTFQADPDSTDKFGTNDDDILTLANGDVLLLWGFHPRSALSPTPSWFSSTFSGTDGPGVRRGTIVYRSTDCGQSFQYVTKIDPGQLPGDAQKVCANPQPTQAPASPPVAPTPPPAAKYANGGSDGQLAKVDADGNVYLTMGCVGYYPVPSKAGFVLDPQNRVNRTYVLISKTPSEGTAWTTLGYLPGPAGWRTAIVPLAGGELALSPGQFGGYLSFAAAQGGQYAFNATTYPIGPSYGWTDSANPIFHAINPRGTGAAIMSHTLVTRVPGSTTKVLIAYPTTANANGTMLDGYQVAIYDAQTKAFAPGLVLPAVQKANHFIMHMVAIDPGFGPILLYWYDVDGNAQTATVRGRLVFEDGTFSKDFAVATDPGFKKPGVIYPPGMSPIVPHSFPVTTGWYGDYITAGGDTPHVVVAFPTSEQFNYYPMWVEGGQTAQYSHVVVNRTVAIALSNLGTMQKLPILIPKWKPAPPPVEMRPDLRIAPIEELPEQIHPHHFF